jgi:hypothetical protein
MRKAIGPKRSSPQASQASASIATSSGVAVRAASWPGIGALSRMT